MIAEPGANPWRPAQFPAGPPLLSVVVDTEEEFDWSKPHDRASTGVSNIRHQARAHRVFERYGVRPTYVIDYPVAAQRDGFAPLRELRDAGACEIGAHLHPWVNPPHDEPVTYRNSYPGNLPAPLERAKLAALTETIGANFGLAPTSYRAGRYGVGPATGASLAALGYTVDSSVIPGVDLGADDGPDFSRCPDRPYWLGAGLLEVPLSHAWIGPLAAPARHLRGALASPVARRLRLGGILARGRLAESFRLTPEGIPAVDAIRLAGTLARRGAPVLVYSYHSPSLDPGHTPYVGSQAELGRFLDSIARFLDHALGVLGVRPATLAEVHAAASAASATMAA